MAAYSAYNKFGIPETPFRMTLFFVRCDTVALQADSLIRRLGILVYIQETYLAEYRS